VPFGSELTNDVLSCEDGKNIPLVNSDPNAFAFETVEARESWLGFLPYPV
jgi:hypothetical protein